MNITYNYFKVEVREINELKIKVLV